jgi:hypothetical protein
MVNTTTTKPGTIDNPNDSVQNGLEFILAHLSPPYFPRSIMTHRLGRQILVYGIDEAMRYYSESEFLDCRISAYPPQPSTCSYVFLGIPSESRHQQRSNLSSDSLPA